MKLSILLAVVSLIASTHASPAPLPTPAPIDISSQNADHFGAAVIDARAPTWPTGSAQVAASTWTMADLAVATPTAIPVPSANGQDGEDTSVSQGPDDTQGQGGMLLEQESGAAELRARWRGVLAAVLAVGFGVGVL